MWEKSDVKKVTVAGVVVIQYHSHCETEAVKNNLTNKLLLICLQSCIYIY